VAGISHCLRQLGDVRSAAEDPASAYLIRSRLRRVILSCARSVAQSAGAPKPDIPGVFVAPQGCSEREARILTLCNRIHSIARELCQPSESFDVRWERGWQLLRAELDELEQVLRTTANDRSAVPTNSLRGID